MSFKEVNPRQNFPELEEEISVFWEKNKIYEKSLEHRDKQKVFNFYDGPPFATGLPHYGHILAMTIKDAVVRYKTMRGYYVPRKFGWDCHGLPVENLIEKELGISGKPDIEKLGIDKFNQACRDSVLRYTGEWKKTITRMGRWGDLDNVYVTMDSDYTESIWWVFKQIWDKDLIYKGFKSMPYCPRCGTPLSNFETNLGYKENTIDPSVFIKFKVKGEDNTYLLAWTTTPWTLPGNAALAIGPDIKYVKIKIDSDFYILAEDRLEAIDDKYTITERIKNNEELVGLEYEPLYNFIKFDKKAHYVAEADFVTTTDGTGIVHVAPAFGEEDLKLGLKLDLPLISHVDKNGHLVSETKQFAGMFVKDADVPIINDLETRGLMYKHGTVKHTYPFCWRCDSPLIYYAISTWFVKVSAIRDRLVENNKQIHWTPSHIKDGRFGKWLEDARDWAITRNRYWGAPVPIWKCDDCGEYKCVGSKEELKELATTGYKADIDLHRPEIDAVKLKCNCGGQMNRIEEVLDCWFESGSMPYAQFHYPFNKEVDFKQRFPADFIAEGLDQTRGWFYTLHVLSTILFDSPAFLNCIVNGIVLAKDGKKLSKRLRNYPEPDEIFNQQGADALRWFLLTSPASAAQDVRFSADNVADTVRRVTLIYWNVYSFFVRYANMDKWQPGKEIESKNVLDQWIISYLQETIAESTKQLDNYDLARGLRPIEKFITDLSTWYLRRSRKRRDPEFYSTMYYVVMNLTAIMAPFMPFITEQVYQNLSMLSSTNKQNKTKRPESIHLIDWPEVDEKLLDRKLMVKMEKVRKIVEGAHSLRKRYELRVRQPLQEMQIMNAKLDDEQLLQIIAEEINVKQIKEVTDTPKDYKRLTVDNMKLFLDTELTQELEYEGLAREIIRYVQVLRKKMRFSPSDKIKIHCQAENKKVTAAITDFSKFITSQTIAESIDDKMPQDSPEVLTKGDITITISKN